MSYDLAIWRGPRPADDGAAGDEYERRFDAAELARLPPSTEMAAFRADLLASEAALQQPGEYPRFDMFATGDFLYASMTFDDAEEGSALITELARRHDLIVYDPQLESLV